MRATISGSCILVAAVLVQGCGGDPVPLVDAGAFDAGAFDAGEVDAGMSVDTCSPLVEADVDFGGRVEHLSAPISRGAIYVAQIQHGIGAPCLPNSVDAEGRTTTLVVEGAPNPALDPDESTGPAGVEIPADACPMGAACVYRTYPAGPLCSFLITEHAARPGDCARYELKEPCVLDGEPDRTAHVRLLSMRVQGPVAFETILDRGTDCVPLLLDRQCVLPITCPECPACDPIRPTPEAGLPDAGPVEAGTTPAMDAAVDAGPMDAAFAADAPDG